MNAFLGAVLIKDSTFKTWEGGARSKRLRGGPKLNYVYVHMLA